MIGPVKLSLMIELILDHIAGLLKQFKRELLKDLLGEIRSSEATLRYELYEVRKQLSRLETVQGTSVNKAQDPWKSSKSGSVVIFPAKT